MTPFLSTARGYLSHLPDPQHRQRGLGHAAAAAPLIKLGQQLRGGSPSLLPAPPIPLPLPTLPWALLGALGGLPCTRQWGGRARAPRVPMQKLIGRSCVGATVLMPKSFGGSERAPCAPAQPCWCPWARRARHGTAGYGMVQDGMARYGTVTHGMVQDGTAWHGMARDGMAQHRMARYSMVWHGTAQYGTAQAVQVQHSTCCASHPLPVGTRTTPAPAGPRGSPHTPSTSPASGFPPLCPLCPLALLLLALPPPPVLAVLGL